MGIAIIIPNADFSNSPLGKVTVVETPEKKAEKIVSAYASNVGVTTYNNSLKSMVKSLIELDVFDKLDIYPMIGDSLEKKCVNLNPNGFQGVDLLVGGNASNSDNCITFVNTLSCGNFSSAIIKSSNDINDNFFIFADAKYNLNSLKMSRFFNTLRVSGGNGFAVGTANNPLIGDGEPAFCSNYHRSGSIVSSVRAKERVKFIVTLDDTTMYLNDGSAVEKNIGETVTEYNITNALGGASQSTESGIEIAATNTEFNGNVYMFAKGDIPLDKAEQVYAILKECAESIA